MTYSNEEFASKVEWEGGVEAALLDYGLRADDLTDTNSDLYRLVSEFDKMRPMLGQLIADIEEELEKWS